MNFIELSLAASFLGADYHRSMVRRSVKTIDPHFKSKKAARKKAKRSKRGLH